MKLRIGLTLIVAFAAAAISFGQATHLTLEVGNPAPKVAYGKWIKGSPVSDFKRGKVYVVEFWATWCGPCMRSIPHLTEMAKKYKAVDFVGMSVWEDDQAKVEPFVTKMGDGMAYNIAMDKVPAGDKRGSHGTMAQTWLKAAGREGIPSAFIVDKEGNVAWVGNPLIDPIDETLDKVVNDKFGPDDYAKAKGAQEADAALALFHQRINDAMGGTDDSKVLPILDEMMSSTNINIQKEGGFNKFSYLLSKKKFDEAYAVASALVATTIKDDSDSLNSLAWTIVDPNNGPATKNLDIAMSAATRSVELKKDPASLDTLARVYFLKGDKAKALEIENEAMALAPADQKKDYEKTIKEYGG
jgi:thiol-disulfide isomerase/thioredoxin